MTFRESGCSSHSLSRRDFIAATSAVALAPGLLLSSDAAAALRERRIVPMGPGAKYVPQIRAAFVRRKGEYGMRWPGAVFDGEAALRRYTQDIREAERALGLKIDLRPEPIHSAVEAGTWLAEAKSAKPDGLLVLLLDRQEHAWPTAAKAVETGIPTVVFSPVGTSFTTNTAPLSEKQGVFIASTSDFSQARYGLKMLKAQARLREMRYLVIRGAERRDDVMPFFGTRLRVLPAREFLEVYQATPLTDEIKSMASDYLKAARKIHGPTREDLHNGIKSYVVARTLLEREEADGITMDCLGALGKTKVSLPCIAWSKMLDHGIPAACEADLSAVITHALVQFLFDRPGFQQDPVAETARECLIGAHCSCPTRLNGFQARPEPYTITHHHGLRDAVPRTIWRPGQRVTVADVILPGRPEIAKQEDPAVPQLVISTGTVVDNLSVPPAGGCVVSVMVKLDTQPDLLRYPGFHQLFFYGDFKPELRAYCQLFGIAPLLA